MRRPSGACASLRRAISWVGRWVMSRPANSMVPSRARGLPQIGHHQRGFAGAVGADQRDDLAVVDVEVDALERHHAAVEGLHAAHGEERGGHSPTSASTLRDVLVGDAEIGGDHLRIVAHRVRRAVGDLDAIVEHDHVVGNLHHHRHVVLDQQDRDGVLVADGEQQRVELGAFARIEAGRRLVEAEQHRIGAHGARDLQPPLRAIGQVAGRIVGARQQPDALEPVARLVDRGAFGDGIGGKAENAEQRVARREHQPVVLGDQQVFQHRHAGKQADVLEGAGDARLLGDEIFRHALELVERAVGAREAALAAVGERFQLAPHRRHRRGAARCGLRSACRSR